jgi:restriction system protein
MAIPDYQTLMLPVLKACALREVRIADVIDELSAEFGLTDEERDQLLPSGRQTTFSNRIFWARTYLGKAALVTSAGRGRYSISERGRAVLAKNPSHIDLKFLRQFPEFTQFRENSETAGDRSEDEARLTPTPTTDQQALTPDEIMRVAHRGLETALADDLLRRVRQAPPAFFERVIVQVLLAMGYGEREAASGVRISLGPWLDQEALAGFAAALQRVRREAD